jgi:hypothetical protein
MLQAIYAQQMATNGTNGVSVTIDLDAVQQNHQGGK